MPRTYTTIRKIDNLGRIVLPIEIRRSLKITKDEDLVISTHGDIIYIKKQQKNCLFCNSTKDLSEYLDKCVCRKCILSLVKEIS